MLMGTDTAPIKEMATESTPNPDASGPVFAASFADDLHTLFQWRRDVRRFHSTPLDEPQLADVLSRAVSTAPTVGLSEPWRIIRVDSAPAKALVKENFETCNQAALTGYDGEDAKLYASLKLAGLETAPVQLAVFCDAGTAQGKGLGTATMPEMYAYSVVCAVMQFWLAARAVGLGVGWVSILDPDQLSTDLNIEPGWKLIAYLCVGYPEEDHLDPELERAGWENRTTTPLEIITR